MNVTLRGRKQHFRTVSFDAEHNRVVLIDQKILPHTFSLAETEDFKQTALAIKDMCIYEAPAPTA